VCGRENLVDEEAIAGAGLKNQRKKTALGPHQYLKSRSIYLPLFGNMAGCRINLTFGITLPEEENLLKRSETSVALDDKAVAC
jgi:hypothetical protein